MTIKELDEQLEEIYEIAETSNLTICDDRETELEFKLTWLKGMYIVLCEKLTPTKKEGE